MTNKIIAGMLLIIAVFVGSSVMAEDRFRDLPDLTISAFKAGDLNKAKAYAEEMLARALQNKNEFEYGSAIYYGNMVLGCLALKAEDITKAKEYLLASGKTIGSPVLNSFGPNMILAKELLERGEKETVLQFFQLCEGFWKRHTDKLRQWSSVVKAGGIPDFGANLDYWN